MKIFFIKNIIFLVISVLIFMAVRSFWLNAANVYKDGARIICEEKRKAVRSGKLRYKPGKKNVLFMGDSKILSGIIPDYFDALMQDKTYSLNLSLPALPIGPHYFELKDYLSHNPPPEYIVLLLKTASEVPRTQAEAYTTQGIKFPEEMFSYLVKLKNKKIIINYIYPRILYREYLGQYFYSLFFNYSDIRKMKKNKSEIVSNMISDRGYYFIKENAIFPDARIPPGYKIQFSPSAQKQRISFRKQKKSLFDDPYVELFFNLTTANNIKVLLIREYRWIGNTFIVSNLYDHDEIITLLDRYENVYTSRNGWRVKYYKNEFFSDINHVNYDGAKKYTKEISREFLEVFGEELSDVD